MNALARNFEVTKAKPHPADDLSFMTRKAPRGSGIDYWSVQGTGSYSGDCEVGRRLALEYLTYLGEHPTYGNTTLLGCIVGDMLKRPEVAGGKLTGIEIAFLSAVNKHAMGFIYAAKELGIDRSNLGLGGAD